MTIRFRMREGHPPQMKVRRHRWAVLAVGALLASLLAAGTSPVAAIDNRSKPDYPAEASACVGPATEDAGFLDVDGQANEDAINCLAHYGITKGTSEGIFSPLMGVTRLQMALYLARAAGASGLTAI